jgi:hypothetical protein
LNKRGPAVAPTLQNAGPTQSTTKEKRPAGERTRRKSAHKIQTPRRREGANGVRQKRLTPLTLNVSGRTRGSGESVYARTQRPMSRFVTTTPSIPEKTERGSGRKKSNRPGLSKEGNARFVEYYLMLRVVSKAETTQTKSAQTTTTERADPGVCCATRVTRCWAATKTGCDPGDWCSPPWTRIWRVLPWTSTSSFICQNPKYRRTNRHENRSRKRRR